MGWWKLCHWGGSGRTVNSLYCGVNGPHNHFLFAVAVFPHVPNTTITRRLNTVALYQEFLGRRIAAGEAPKGLDQSFAAGLEISPSMWSQIKSARPIGDKLARQIEQHTGKPAGWLDAAHEEAPLAGAAEERMLRAAGSYWRSANAIEKRALMKLLQRRA